MRLPKLQIASLDTGMGGDHDYEWSFWPHVDSSDGIRVEFDTRDGVLVMGVRGEVDALTGSSFSAALSQLCRQRCDAAVVDLTGVEFLGSAALRELAVFGRQFHDRSFQWAIAGGRATMRPLRVLGLDVGLPLCWSVQDAMALVRRDG